jgi:hypothetical protein
LEQQVIDCGLVVERDVCDLGGHCEDDVEVSNRQQVGGGGGPPRGGGGLGGDRPPETTLRTDMAARRGLPDAP